MKFIENENLYLHNDGSLTIRHGNTRIDIDWHVDDSDIGIRITFQMNSVLIGWRKLLSNSEVFAARTGICSQFSS